MFSRYLLISSALFLAIIGLALTFASDDLLQLGCSPSPRSHVLLGQLLGAVCCGFALMNWMSKGIIMGGIYGRPLAMGNLTHFTIGALALIKVSFVRHGPWPLIALTAAYALFACLLAWVAFSHPQQAEPKT